MGRFIIFFFCFAPLSSGAAQPDFDMEELLGIEAAIRNTSLSSRCQELIKKKNEKAKIKRRMGSLIRRVDKILNSPFSQTRQTPINNLKMSRRKLKNERSLISTRIKEMEESIIRAGCPGIEL